MEFKRPSERADEKRKFHTFGAAVALVSTLSISPIATAQGPTQSPKLTCATVDENNRITRAEFLKYDAETTAKYRGNDRPDLVRRGDMSACFGDCIFMTAVNGGREWLLANIDTKEGHLATAGNLDGTEIISVGTRNLFTNEWKVIASTPLAVTAQRYKEMTGHVPQTYRLVVEEGNDPKEGYYVQIFAVPTEEKGAMPDFSKDGLPYAMSGYYGGKGGEGNGLVCKSAPLAMK